MSAACSGWCNAANLNSERIAANREFRVRSFCPSPVFKVIEEYRNDRGVEVTESRAQGPVSVSSCTRQEQQPERVRCTRPTVCGLAWRCS